MQGHTDAKDKMYIQTAFYCFAGVTGWLFQTHWGTFLPSIFPSTVFFVSESPLMCLVPPVSPQDFVSELLDKIRGMQKLSTPQKKWCPPPPLHLSPHLSSSYRAFYPFISMSVFFHWRTCFLSSLDPFFISFSLLPGSSPINRSYFYLFCDLKLLFVGFPS